MSIIFHTVDGWWHAVQALMILEMNIVYGTEYHSNLLMFSRSIHEDIVARCIGNIISWRLV